MASHTLDPALRAEKAPAPRSATGDKPYEEYDSTVNEMDAAPALASVLPTTGPATVNLPLRNLAQPDTAAPYKINQEHEEVFRPLQEVVDERNVAENQALPPTTVEQLRGMIAERDAKVAELEQRLADQGKELEEAKNRIRELEKVVENVWSSIANESNKRARR
ncbi:hypothetical protein J4E80_006927 [Alternaria sp. BMP 0032]|nr:hypothetical protein J4E80_006927 [Alternaria sp. BMP 0032]